MRVACRYALTATASLIPAFSPDVGLADSGASRMIEIGNVRFDQGRRSAEAHPSPEPDPRVRLRMDRRSSPANDAAIMRTTLRLPQEAVFISFAIQDPSLSGHACPQRRRGSLIDVHRRRIDDNAVFVAGAFE